MRNKFSKKIICLAVVAVLLIAGVSVKGAMAYFTTYVLAEGSETLELGFTETIIQEEVIDGKKIVVISNTGTADCYVRVRAIVAEKYKDSITDTEPDDADNWTSKKGEFYEYKSVLKAGESTTPLHINISTIATAPGEDATDFNVIVIQECTPVLYDENGDTYAGWDDNDLKNDFIIEKR